MLREDDENLKDRHNILLTQYRVFIDIYKQHFDLYLKGVILYLAAMSVIAGLIFGRNKNIPCRLALSALIPIGSLIGLYGFHKSRRWLCELESVMHNIETELKLGVFPFSGPKGIINTMMYIAAAIFMFGLVNLVYLAC